MNKVIIFTVIAIIAISIIAGCREEVVMVPQTVITTDTNGVSVTNIVMVKKTNSFDWGAFAGAVAEAMEEVDFGEVDFDFDVE